ncbi:protein adenylyltransferase SelO [Halomonas nitroreducens]|uniref:Protein nucleotidyltransferase YdiU n=1 Tax=Halomonas nitroreducens TaxID=447425 RepID=A0A3S0HVY0_9GAMM|nr:YdiU family protein [Halomonas nitroreducens]RTR06939.1 YdiU family protein [Halomonas nitroreducens]
MFPSFSLRYARLPARLRADCLPTPVAEPRLVAFNRELAEELGFDLAAFDAGRAAEVFAGNAVPEGAEPLAMAYAGHQFGNFVPQLGDGRALLLGEVVDRRGRLRDLQLKGSGRTPFSRGGDGRAPLGPVLREYLVSEAMHALGIPTTRALAAVTSGERVFRRIPEPGAVLTRVAASHLRVGTFQYFAARRDTEAVQLLADEAIARHYPDLPGELAEGPLGERYLALLEAVVGRQADLVARWMGTGFIHGVMNTDNTSISGETIDYGPCAFMDTYDPRTVFSSIDERGRYAYLNQPVIAQWNLARFAETLLPLIDDDSERAIARATAVIEGFTERYEASWQAVMGGKLGLALQEEGDGALAQGLLDAMQAGHADFTLAFRRLADVLDGPEGEARLAALFDDREALAAWLPRWRERLAREGADESEIARRLRGTNPAVIPRNHRVEQALAAAAEEDDFAPFEALLAVITRPFEEPHGEVDYTRPPHDGEKVLRTFCGT